MVAPETFFDNTVTCYILLYWNCFVQVMKIIDNIRPDRQVVMFSATFPRQMEALARRILNKPIEIQVIRLNSCLKREY